MDIKTQKMLADVILDAQKNAVKSYTTTAKVKGVSNDVVYVEIPGSDRVTPVKNTSVAVKKGDTVDLVVSHEDTHITGNRSDVATPQSSTKELSQAMEANRLEIDNKLDLTNNKIKMVNNDIEMIDNTITQQGNTITEINNTIDSQNNTITQQGNTITKINNTVTEVNNKVESQSNSITQINNTITQQGNTITEMGNKVNSQGNTITQMNDTITSQGNTITQLDNKVISQGNTITQMNDTVTSQGNTITQQGNTITQMNSTIETLDSTVETQGSAIQTLDSSIKVVNSAFVIQNGKLTGISEIMTNLLDSDYVTTDLLNADVAWIENGKIKKGAIGTVEIHDSSITTAKIAELSADVIKTGTLKTECLILTTDEVDPKTGEKKVALITALNAKTKAGEGNILDGAVIKDETIEAAKIKVVDLEAFGATIGNFHIGTSNIYNNKTALTDPTDGVYIGTDGIALGQGSLLNMTDDSPFRVESDGDFHLGRKDSNYINFDPFTGKLNINADSIKMGSSSIATIDDVEGIVVGGRNMIRNSNFELPGNPNWANLSEYVCITNEGRNGGYCIKQMGEFNKDRTTFNSVGNKSNNIKIKANDTFTFSGWYKVQNYVAGTTNNFVRPYVAYYKSDGSWVSETAIIDVISPDATDWTYVKATLKVPNTSTIDYMIFSLYARDYTGIIWWDDIKLEKGNKATDWSPAPEDIKNDTLNEVTTTLKNYATLDVTDDKIYSAVTETKAYTDAIQIGGRNLALQTKDFTENTKYWIIADGFSRSTDNGFTVLSYSRPHVTENQWDRLISTTPIPKEDMHKGLTVSFDFKCDSYDSLENGRVCSVQCFATDYTRVGWYEMASVFDDGEIPIKLDRGRIDGEWVRASVYFDEEKLSVNYTSKTLAYATISFQLVRGGSIHFRKIKMEYGNKATDWSPAPEDIETDIQTVKTIAEQTADKFSWLVKSGTSATNFELTDRTATLVANHINLNGLVTFSGLGNDAQNKINNAENAVNNLEIGGRNMCIGTNQGTKNWGWSMKTGTYTNEEVLEDGIRTCKLTRNNDTQSGWTVIGFNDISRDKWLPDTNYIITVEVKSNVNATFTLYGLAAHDGTGNLSSKIDVINNKTKADEWVTLQWLCRTRNPLPTQTNQMLYMNNMNSEPGVYYQFRNLKIEKGNKATDWSPAPEDISVENIYTPNTTTIDGGKITTGSIKAEQIDVDNLFSQDITATNLTMSGTSKFGNCTIDENGDLVNGKVRLRNAGINVLSNDPYKNTLIKENGISVLDESGNTLRAIGINSTDGLIFEFGTPNQFNLTNKKMTFGSDGVFSIGESNKKALNVHTKKINDTSVATDGIASTSEYGMTKLSTSTSSTSTTLAATPSAVKTAYDKAKSAFSGKGLPWAVFSITDDVNYTAWSEQGPTLTLRSSYSGDRASTFGHGGLFYIYCPYAGRVEINFNFLINNVSSNGYLYARCYGYQYASNGTNELLDFTGMGVVTSSGAQVSGTLVPEVKAGKYIYIVLCSSVAGKTNASSNTTDYKVRLQYRNIYD